MNNEQTIIKNLRLMSDKSKSTDDFKAGLLSKLEDQLSPKPKSNFILSLLTMKKFILPVSILALALVAGGSFALISNNKNDNKEETQAYDYDTAATTESNETENPTSGLRIATDFNKTIAEAQTKTSFTIKRATMRLGNEVLSTIETTTDFPESDPNMDSYFLTYTENGKLAYKVSGMGVEREFIEGEEVSVNGVKAYYYKVPADEITDGTNIAAGENGPSARSLVYWNVDGKSYDVSEFTGMSKEDLLKLAASVK